TPELIGANNLPDTMAIVGNYTQGGGGALDVLVAGDSSFSQLAPSGAVNLDGTLTIETDPAYAPAGGTQFRVLSSGAVPIGTFATVTGTSFATGKYDVTYDADGVVLTVTAVPGAPTSVSATVADSQTVVSFTAPASNGGSAISGYTVT